MQTHLTKNRKDNFALAMRHDGEQSVENGLAMTPAQMYDMAKRGLPITTQNLGITYDEGVSSLDFTPPLEHRRGIDFGDLYEARHDAKAKLRKLRDNGQFKQADVVA